MACRRGAESTQPRHRPNYVLVVYWHLNMESPNLRMAMVQSNSSSPPTVAKEYAGKWIAWNRRRTAIVGCGRTLPEAAAAAKFAGEREPGFEWVPPANRRLVGFGR